MTFCFCALTFQSDYEDDVNRVFVVFVSWRNRNVMSNPDSLNHLVHALEQSGNSHVLRPDSAATAGESQVMVDVHTTSAAGTPV